MPLRKPRRLDAAALWEYALRALASRGHSIGEIREKLRRKAERAEDVDGVLSRLKQYALLNDRKFADSVAGSRLQNQGFGRARVLKELRQRRVAPAVAEQAVNETYREADETALIEAFLARKFRRIDLGAYLQEPKNLASAYRKLRTAGFSSGNSIRVLKRYAEEAEQLEGLEGAEAGEDAGGGETA